MKTTNVERPLWQLSRDEQRALIITFIGGLASIIAGAVVVGGAIALAHYEQKGLSLLVLVSFTGVAVFLTTMSVFVVLMAIRHGRLNRPGRPIWMVLGVMYSIILIPSGLLLCLLILTWIGIAAGILGRLW